MIRSERGPESLTAAGKAGPGRIGGSRIDLALYTVIPLWYGCNNNCVICMLAPVKGKLQAVDFDLFKKLVIDIAASGACRRLILSGGEVTTFADLERYVGFAAGLGCFDMIQIQTNGRRLSDAGYLRRLIEAGVNEFFISVHGPREAHDAISRVPGSYDQTMEGIDNLQEHPVNVLTNTVLTSLNYAGLPSFLSGMANNASEMQVWNFFPMEERDARDLIVPVKDLMRLVGDVLPALRSARKPLVLKAFPECLPVCDPVFLDSDFPVALIPDFFWKCLERSGFGACVYKDACRAKKCWGLSGPYAAKYGDERDILSPVL